MLLAFLSLIYRDNISSNLLCLRTASADGPVFATSTTGIRTGSTYSDPTCAPDNNDKLLELRRIREPDSLSTEPWTAGYSTDVSLQDRAATRNLISSEGGRLPHSLAPVPMSIILKLWPCSKIYAMKQKIERVSRTTWSTRYCCRFGEKYISWVFLDTKV